MRSWIRSYPSNQGYLGPINTWGNSENHFLNLLKIINRTILFLKNYESATPSNFRPDPPSRSRPLLPRSTATADLRRRRRRAPGLRHLPLYLWSPAAVALVPSTDGENRPNPPNFPAKFSAPPPPLHAPPAAEVTAVVIARVPPPSSLQTSSVDDVSFSL